MDTIFTENSKTYHPQRLLLNLTKVDLLRGEKICFIKS